MILLRCKWTPLLCITVLRWPPLRHTAIAVQWFIHIKYLHPFTLKIYPRFYGLTAWKSSIILTSCLLFSINMLRCFYVVEVKIYSSKEWLKNECSETRKGQRGCSLSHWGSEIRLIQNRELILLVAVQPPAAVTEGLVIWPTHWLAANSDAMCELHVSVTSEEARGPMLVSQWKNVFHSRQSKWSWQQEDSTEDARSPHTKEEGKWEHRALRTSTHCC